MPEWPYIDMTEIPGTNGELFTMRGIFADFWAELQVKNLSNDCRCHF